MIYITALLFVREGKEELFNEYEACVLPLLDRYNGRILHRIRTFEHLQTANRNEVPYEVHIISFDSPADFQGYKHDEQRKAKAHLFDESVIRAIVIEGSLVAEK